MRIYITNPNTKWEAEIERIPNNGPKAAMHVSIDLYIGPKLMAEKEFRIGTALNTRKFESLSDVEKWLKSACESADLKWDIMATVGGMMSKAGKLTVSVSPSKSLVPWAVREDFAVIFSGLKGALIGAFHGPESHVYNSFYGKYTEKIDKENNNE